LHHLQEVLNIAVDQYTFLGERRYAPFVLSDALTVLFLHDLEKPWKYGGHQGPTPQNHHEQQQFILDKISEYGITLTSDQYIGLKYVHGEGEDYSPHYRVQNPIAAFVHICDTMSARIWHNFPAIGGIGKDGW